MQKMISFQSHKSRRLKMSSFLLLSVFLLTTMTCCSGLNWEGDFLNETLRACVGDTVNMSWKYSLDPGENVTSVGWSVFNKNSKLSNSLTAFIKKDKFISKDRNWGFLPNAGITIKKMGVRSFGFYTVQVGVFTESTRVNHTLSANLTLPEPPATYGNSFSLRKIVKDVPASTSGLVYLGCGPFKSIGQPPVRAFISIPNQKKREMTRFEDEQFVEVLRRPLQKGLYKCRLQIPDVTSRCGQPSKALKKDAALTITANDVDTEKSDADKEIDKLKEEININQLKSNILACDEQTQNLISLLTDIEAENRRLREILNPDCRKQGQCGDIFSMPHST